MHSLPYEDSHLDQLTVCLEHLVLTFTCFFFNVLGTRKSCSSMNSFSKQESTKETEFRTPILEKLQTAKSSSGSQDSNTMLSLDSSAPHVNNQAALSPGESSLFKDNSLVVNMNITRSVKRDPAAETSAMECDETFHSACEEVDTTYYSFEGSSTDSLVNDSYDESENQSKLIQKNVGSTEISLTKESGTHNYVSQKSKTEDSSIGESSRCNDLEEEQEFGIVSSAGKCTADCDITPSADSLLEEVESHGCLESNTESLNTDNKSSSDDEIKTGHDGFCDDLQKGEYGKDSDKVSRPLDDPQFNETANDCDFSDESGSFDAKDSNCNDPKEEGNDEESDRINNPFNGVHFQEDSNDGAFPDGSDSSDDDLLMPPRFLYEKAKLKPDIRTPEKGIAPAYATPSPIMENATAKEEKSIKYKLSFEKLIAEKAKHRERDAVLAEMEAELQRGIKNGGIVQMQVPSTFSDIESEEELTDGKLGKSALQDI